MGRNSSARHCRGAAPIPRREPRVKHILCFRRCLPCPPPQPPLQSRAATAAGNRVPACRSRCRLVLVPAPISRVSLLTDLNGSFTHFRCSAQHAGPVTSGQHLTSHQCQTRQSSNIYTVLQLNTFSVRLNVYVHLTSV